MACSNQTRVAVIPGHHPQAQGATLEVAGVKRTEFQIWDPFARELALTLTTVEGIDPVVVHRPNRRPDKDFGKAITQAAPDLVVELHFNSFPDPSVSGTLTIYREGHAPSRRLSEHFQKHTREEMGLADRATMPRSDLGIMRYTPKDLPVILCEPAFVSNHGDAVTLLSELPDLLKAYRVSITKYVEEEPTL